LVVTRRDLNLAHQAVQSHAAIDFQHEHLVEAKQWQTQSNYLAFLTVNDEPELIKLISKAILIGIKHTILENQI
jgi:peptidyl-tRNA hydrolase